MSTMLLVCWVAGLTSARIPPAIVALRLHADSERAQRVHTLLNATAAIFSFALTILLIPMLAFEWDGGVASYTPLTSLRYADYLPSDAFVVPFTAAPDWFGQIWTFVGSGICLYIASLGIALRVSGRSVAAESRPAGFGFRTGFGVLFALTAVVALAIDGDYSLIFFIILVASALVLAYQANGDYRDVIIPGAGSEPPETSA